VNRLKNLSKIWNSKPKRPLTNASITINENVAATTTSIDKDLVKSRHDLIGPADKISNLRRFRYYIPEDESKLERDYRLLREKINEFNHHYWTQQNLKFLEARKKFIEKYRIEQKYLRKNSKLNNESSSTELNQADEPDSVKMNEFYKKFLDDNYYLHYEYNTKWLKYNFALLIPAVRVYFYRLMKRNK
jgi:hypothetical protein